MFDLQSLNQDHFTWKTALSMALASELVYQKEQAVQNVATRNWQLDGCTFIDRASTQCFVAHTEAAILVAFRGTSALNDWIANLGVSGTRRSYGVVHHGFADAYAHVADDLVATIRALDPASKLIHLTGHSLGGALATIAALELSARFLVASVYTFGQPRLGDLTTVDRISSLYPGAFNRFVFDDDVVTRVPAGYRHVGRLFHFDSDGFLQSQTAEGGGGSTEPPEMSEAEFENLKETARRIQAEAHVAVQSFEESARTESVEKAEIELADRSLEGWFPSVRDHRMSNYVFAVRHQIAPVRAGAVEGLEAYEAAYAPEPADGLELDEGTRAARGAAGPTIPVQVRVRDREWSPPAGVKVNSRIGPFYSLVANEAGIGAMRRDPGVISVNISRDISPTTLEECAVSVPFVNADAIHTGPLNEKGDSAIVAVIDTGIDILHEAFLDAAGNSRIDAIWIQRDTAGPKPAEVDPAYQLDYGTLYTNADIQAFVRNPAATTPARLRDLGVGGYGHGTHVASIAAGRAVGVFGGGMAPEARIVVVVPYTKTEPGSPRSLGYSVAHQDAIAFLDHYRRASGLPMAVNISLGQNAGAHDGTADLEKVIDAATHNGMKPGFVIVKSAGNERGYRGHARVQAAVGGVMVIEWASKEIARNEDYFEFWYHANDALGFTLVDPSGHRYPTVNEDALRGFAQHAGNDVHLNLTVHVPDNDDNRLVVKIVPTEAPIQPGTWSLEIVATRLGTTGNGFVDGWVERNDTRAVEFLDASVDDMTLSIPGTANTVVSVAAIETVTPIRLEKSSSFGPTRRNGPKPDVSAPGTQITAARSGSEDHTAVVTLTGTSMAAPHVTGALALALSARHKHPRLGGKNLNATNLLGMLKRSTGNMMHNKGTGFGRFDALRFFEEAERLDP